MKVNKQPKWFWERWRGLAIDDTVEVDLVAILVDDDGERSRTTATLAVATVASVQLLARHRFTEVVGTITQERIFDRNCKDAITVRIWWQKLNKQLIHS